MAKQKVQKFELANLDANNLTVFTGLEKKQRQLVKDNPYIEVVDNKTYQIAKTRRTALKTGRTGHEKGDKLIGTAVAQFRKQTKDKTASLIIISRPAEDKQQGTISLWEEKIAKKAQDKIDDEAKRVDDINAEIEAKKEALETIKEEVVFSTIDKKTKEFNELVESSKEYDYQEFDLPYDEMIERMTTLFSFAIAGLKTKETERIEEEEQAEIKRLEALKQAQISETNRLFRLSTETIDNYSLEDETGLLDNLQVNVYDTEYDFGEQKDEFDKLVKSSTKKANERVAFLNSEKTRIKAEEDAEELRMKSVMKDRIKQIKKLGMIENEESCNFSGFGLAIDASDIYEADSIENLISEINDYKKSDEEEKARQLKLKPKKNSAIKVVKSISGVAVYETDGSDVDGVMVSFFTELSELIQKFEKKIKSL